ncbi:MAG: hypothetical protein KGZ45_03520 [Clostridium sp.]|nr:hypothetical protein [Clostridium sp.]
MTKTLEAILTIYGTETVVARLMEQIRLLSEVIEVRDEVAAVVNQYSSDTEYIYSLCEYTNLITYASDNVQLVDNHWEDESAKKELVEDALQRKRKGGSATVSIYLFPTEG